MEIDQNEFRIQFLVINVHGQAEIITRIIKFRQNELIEDFNVLRNVDKNLDQD